MAEDLKQRLEHIIKLIRELNADLAVTPYSELRKADLQTRYAFGGAGSPFAGIGLKPIVPINAEHQRARIFSTDIDYASYRERLRAQKMPVPMIWERFPPQNAAEREEMRAALASYSAAREKALAPTLSGYDKFVHTEARKEAKRRQIPLEQLLSDKNFLAQCEAVWNIIGVA